MDLIQSVDTFEKLIYALLTAMLMVVLVAALVDLAFFLFISLAAASPYVLEAHELIAILGSFLLILIGVELLDTIKLYFRENAIHVEIVLLLAVIAVARKVILLDPTGMTGIDYGLELMGIGIIVAGLSGSYYLIKKAGLST
jgi:uncharacterized membrane protein (DUF373 family)